MEEKELKEMKLGQLCSLQKIINNVNKTKSDLSDEIKFICQDKSLPLDERWELFVTSDLGDHSPYIIDFENYNIEGREKYQLVNFIDIITFQLEDLGFYDYNEIINEVNFNLESYNKELKEINKLREEVLEKWIKSFEIDW